MADEGFSGLEHGRIRQGLSGGGALLLRDGPGGATCTAEPREGRAFHLRRVCRPEPGAPRTAKGIPPAAHIEEADLCAETVEALLSRQESR